MATQKSSASTKKSLELRLPQLRSNLLSLLGSVKSDAKLREAFVKNPTKVIAAKVSSKAISAKQVSEANRLLFALIANDKMRAWLSSYEPKATGKAGKEEFAAAFAEQVASIGDKNIIVAMIGNELVGNGIPGLTNVAYQCVCNETTGKQSCACTPVAKNQTAFGNNVMDPETVRVISEALVARAKSLVKSGALANLKETVG